MAGVGTVLGIIASASQGNVGGVAAGVGELATGGTTEEGQFGTNPDLCQRSYMAWCKQFAPEKLAVGGRVWDNPNSIYWFGENAWSKIRDAEALSGGIPAFDRNLNYMGNTVDGMMPTNTSSTPGTSRKTGVVGQAMSNVANWWAKLPSWAKWAIPAAVALFFIWLLFFRGGRTRRKYRKTKRKMRRLRSRVRRRSRRRARRRSYKQAPQRP